MGFVVLLSPSLMTVGTTFPTKTLLMKTMKQQLEFIHSIIFYTSSSSSSLLDSYGFDTERNFALPYGTWVQRGLSDFRMKAPCRKSVVYLVPTATPCSQPKKNTQNGKIRHNGKEPNMQEEEELEEEGQEKLSCSGSRFLCST